MSKRSFGTHNGSFHADEVTACALLLLFDLVDRSKIVRTRDLEILKGCDYVCDVGGVYDATLHRFDHHQSNYLGNLSSAGMVLKYLKDEKYIDEKLFYYLNSSLIIGVDAIDNGKITPLVGHCSFSAVVANFIPTRYNAEEHSIDSAFFQALDFVYGHLKRLVEKFHYIQECRETVRREMEKQRSVLLFDEPMPWMESFFDLGGEHHPALFLVMPTGKQWKLRGIPPSYDKKMQVRLPLPKEWAGLMGDDLRQKTKLPGALFCHKGGFISIWETKEEALKALEIVLKQRGKHESQDNL